MIEMRSDTFTLPTPAMRTAMAKAAVGDDCYGEDPTVKRLERKASECLGKEAACLMPSGTMANLAAILAQCPRGSSVVVGDESDIYLYEAAGAAVCGGLGYLPVQNRADGTLSPTGLRAAFPDDPSDPQYSLPSLICLENTHNRCGGVALPAAYLDEVAELARAYGVPVHLDGARIFNAAIARGVPAAQLAAPADSVQFCLSKGLSAPVGSIVAGTAELIAKVRRVRKMLGGGMRQAGVVAAAGIVALNEMPDRLVEDHHNARRLAEGLATLPQIDIDPTSVETNIVLFRLRTKRLAWSRVVHKAASAGVALAGFGRERIRAVTHSGVSASDVERAVAVLADVLAEHDTDAVARAE